MLTHFVKIKIFANNFKVKITKNIQLIVLYNSFFLLLVHTVTKQSYNLQMQFCIYFVLLF